MRVTVLLAAALVAVSVYAEQLPVEHFGHLPMVQNPVVSPNGEWVAAVLNGEEGPTIVVAPFGSQELEAIVKLKYGDDRIEWIEWANDERLLISVSEAAEQTRERFRVRRLYQVKRDGSGLRQVRRKAADNAPPWTQDLDTDRVLSTLRDDPDHILMEVYDYRDEGFAVFKVNLEKNRFEKLFPNTYDVRSWFVDINDEVVLGIERYRNTLTLWYRPAGEREFREFHSWEAFEDETFNPLHIEGNRAIVMSDRVTGFESAWEYDIETGEFGEMIFGADGHDLAGGILDNDRSGIIGFFYYDHYREDHYIDAQAAAVRKTVAESFPGYATSVVSLSYDYQRMIVSAQRDDSPPKYIWMDLGGPSAGVWYSQYPYLENQQLAYMAPIEFEASDGMRIEGYLTLPASWEGDKPSLIVHPHGGPHARDYRYFDPFVQFFANRGHAVLQVNFRGSEGYGTDFQTAGYKQWGLRMQQDVYDAVDWLASQDLIDMERKCMVGFSYGGYVALTAAFQRPDDYRCVASFAGIADVEEMVELDSLRTETKVAIARMVGDIEDKADKEMLRSVSAVNNVQSIRAPILLIHGIQDTRVRVGQSRDFEYRAREAGVEVEYIEIEDGTHFIDEYVNRMTVFKALDGFLAEHL